MGVDVQQFWRAGYLVVRQCIAPATVAAWRGSAVVHRQGDLLTNGDLSGVITDSPLPQIARAILGERPCYFGDSAARIGDEIGSFHKDNVDRSDCDGPDWSVPRYPIIRFGIYTQAHGATPGGIDLRECSHMHADLTSGRHVSPAVAPGDVVLWCHRTTHSGNSMVARGGYRPAPGSLAWKLLLHAPPVRRRSPAERVAIFASFGARGPLLDRYLRHLNGRDYMRRQWAECSWSADVRRRVESAGLDLIEPASCTALN